MAIDYDNRAVWFAVNGAWIDGNGSQSSAIVLSQIIAGDISSAAFKWGPGIGANIDDIVIYSRDRDCIAHTNFGQRAYTYTAPTGFKALCTTNLSAPTIGSGSTSVASKFFNTVLYTGDGSAGNAKSGLGFQPDFLWFKSRSAARSHALYNSVMTRTFGMASESSSGQYTSAAGRDLASFDSDGFTVGVPENFGSTNTNGDSIVAWAWRASNATAVTNTSGSITSTLSASPTSGFSIVTWTGTGTAATVGHGLGVAPSMIIFKARSITENWNSYHISLGASALIALNSSNASSATGDFSATSPTPSVFSIGTGSGNNQNGTTYLAYCFAAVEGYSTFGSYTGNGSSDGPFVHTGFRPAFILIKRTDTGSSDWQIIDTKRDTYNASGLLLQPNLTAAESDARPVLDILSNGFKHRNTYNVTNVSAATYIYMAFAETPFKYSLAR